MRHRMFGTLLALALPLSFVATAPVRVAADTGQVATIDGNIVNGNAIGLTVYSVPAPQTIDISGIESSLDLVPDPVGATSMSMKRTLWSYEAAAGNARVRTWSYDATGQTSVTPTGQDCVPTLTDGGGITGNGRGVAFDPVTADLWISRLTIFVGDGKLHLIVPPNVDSTCPEVKTLAVHSQDGKPIQDDFGALDVDPMSKHVWAAGYKPVSSGGVLKSFLYLVNRNNGLVIQSCWVPFRDGGVGNGTLSTMRIPPGQNDPFGGSGNYLLTDAGEPLTFPNSVEVIDQADCHNGQQAPSLGELAKGHGIDGLDYEWNGSTSNDVFTSWYNDGGPVPDFTTNHIVGSNGGISEVEDISMCGYRATFVTTPGSAGNDFCPYP